MRGHPQPTGDVVDAPMVERFRRELVRGLGVSRRRAGTDADCERVERDAVRIEDHDLAEGGSDSGRAIARGGSSGRAIAGGGNSRRAIARGGNSGRAIARGGVARVAGRPGHPDSLGALDIGEAEHSASLVDLIAALEELKSAACALQAEATVALDRAERDRQALAGVPASRRGLGIGAQVGLARRESPHRGAELLGAAKVWLAEMPHTFEALRAGALTEHRATLLAQHTACLEVEDRREVDSLLCADPAALVGVGTRRLVALARGHAARLDPAAMVRRARRAESERRVTLRPAPDTMTYLTALLPVAQGVAVYAALCRAADAAAVAPEVGARDSVEHRADAVGALGWTGSLAAADVTVAVAAAGGKGGAEASGRPGATAAESGTRAALPEWAASGEDGARVDARRRARRGRGQVMADTLVELVTGQSSASAVPVTVNLVLSDATLLGAGHEAGVLPDSGPVPAQIARELVAAGIDSDAAWLRRLYADPGGDLVAMTSRSRFHPDGLAEFLRIRDQGMCRTPYCGAPIRQIDHIVPSAAGGATDAANGEGLCVACNLAKEAPGWARRSVDRSGALRPTLGTDSDTVAAEPSSGHTVLTTTPTGHEHLSRAPRMPVAATSNRGATSPGRGDMAAGSAGWTPPGEASVREVRSVIDTCFAVLVTELSDLAA